MGASVDSVVLIGPTAAGKSTIGRLLAKRLNRPFVDLDTEIAQRYQTSIAEIFKQQGEQAFRHYESAVLHEWVERQDTQVLATGAGCVLSEKNRQCLRAAGTVVWLHVSERHQRLRSQTAHHRPLLANNREQVLEDMARVRTPLYEELADLRVMNEGQTPEQTTAAILTYLKQQ